MDEQGYLLSEQSAKRLGKIANAFFGNGGNVKGPGFVPSFGGDSDAVSYWVSIIAPLSGNCNYSGYIVNPKTGDYDGSTNFDANFFETAVYGLSEQVIVVNPVEQYTGQHHSLRGFVPCYHARTNSDGTKVMLTYAFAFTLWTSCQDVADADYMGSEDVDGDE